MSNSPNAVLYTLSSMFEPADMFFPPPSFTPAPLSPDNYATACNAEASSSELLRSLTPEEIRAAGILSGLRLPNSPRSVVDAGHYARENIGSSLDTHDRYGDARLLCSATASYDAPLSASPPPSLPPFIHEASSSSLTLDHTLPRVRSLVPPSSAFPMDQYDKVDDAAEVPADDSALAARSMPVRKTCSSTRVRPRRATKPVKATKILHHYSTVVCLYARLHHCDRRLFVLRHGHSRPPALVGQ